MFKGLTREQSLLRPNMLSAKEIDVPVHSQQRACEAGTMYPIPDKGEVILLEDN